MRSGSPGVRLGRAFALSLALHFAAFFPYPAAPRAVPPRLVVQLPAPLPERVEPLPEAAATVPPVPTSEPAKPAVPRALAGKALASALQKMTREEFYPREAIERGWEGKVILLLSLAQDGRVEAIEIASGSGHTVLDAAALKAAGRIDRVPGARRQVLLPVEFRLE